MPNWNELGPVFNPMSAKVAPKEEKVAPLTREQAASAIHKITGAMPGYGGAAPLKHTLYIPDGYVPWIEVVGDKVTVEMRPSENVHPSVQHWNGNPAYVTSSDMEAYWDSVAEWVDAQAASMPTATD